MEENHLKSYVVAAAVWVVFWLLLGALYVSFSSDMDIIDIAGEISQSFSGYFSVNRFYYGHKENINYCFYSLILFSAISLHFYINSFPKIKEKLSFSKALFLTTSIVLGFLIIFQTIGHFENIKNRFKDFNGKTLTAREIVLSGEVARFALFCHDVIKEKASAEVLTDLDFSKDPGQGKFVGLAYYLYPIDIRRIRKDFPKYLILFEKDNAIESVPSGYKVLASKDTRNLIAVKQ